LSATQQDGTEPKARPAGELSELIKALKETHAVEAVPVKRPGPAARSERPVTARIRRMAETVPAMDVEPEQAQGEREEPVAAPAKESPTPAVRVPKSATHDRRESPRRRYQKWLF
jgi:hypothetical protein